MNWRRVFLLTALTAGCLDPRSAQLDVLDASPDAARDAEAGARPDAGAVVVDAASPTADSDASPTHADSGASAAGDAAPPAAHDIEVAPGTTTLSNDFTATVTGATAGRIGAVALAENLGTVEIDGKAWPAFANERQEWAGFALTLVQTLVVTDDALYPMWLYCSGSTFDGVYYEGTDGTAMTWAPATSGSCDVTASPAMNSTPVPALKLAFPAADHGFSVRGGPLALEPGQSGSFETATAVWQVHPFEAVDCTVDCGTPGWWELHSLLWDGTSACFSIFYFFDGRASQVSYSTCLPGLDDAVGAQTFGGSWSLAP